MLDPLELELQIIVSHHVDAGNRTWVSGRTSAPLTTFLNLVSACVHMCIHYSHGEVRGHFSSSTMLVLGVKLGSSCFMAGTFTHGATLPALLFILGESLAKLPSWS